MAQNALHLDWNALHRDAFQGRHCLVTGGAGFIGSHVVDALVALGARVRVLDDLSGGSRSNLNPDAELIEGSVLDEATCDAAAEHFELIFHLAAKVSVPGSVDDPVAYHDVDATGTLRLLESAKRAGANRVIYSASSSAYGDAPSLPKREDMPPLPMSPYAAAKLAGEGYCRAFSSVYDFDAVSLRYFNIFGPRQNANSAYAGVIAAFARDLLAGKAPTIFGDGSASRDFTFVANAVHANLLAARHAAPLTGEIYNVGIGERITIAQLADAMIEASGRANLTPAFAPPRVGDVAHSLADLEKIRDVLGYEPVTSFADGLQQTMDWYRTEAGR